VGNSTTRQPKSNAKESKTKEQTQEERSKP
jgi:hypothetical protein